MTKLLRHVCPLTVLTSVDSLSAAVPKLNCWSRGSSWPLLWFSLSKHWNRYAETNMQPVQTDMMSLTHLLSWDLANYQIMLMTNHLLNSITYLPTLIEQKSRKRYLESAKKWDILTNLMKIAKSIKLRKSRTTVNLEQKIGTIPLKTGQLESMQ